MDALYVNEFKVSGELKSVSRKVLDNGSVIVEAEIANHFDPPRGKSKTFYFIISAWGDLGKKLESLSVGTRLVAVGRMENWRGTRPDGTAYTSYYKVQAKEIHLIESALSEAQPKTEDSYDSSIDIPF
jgi:hypothetical protein